MSIENPSAFPSRVDEPMMGGGSYRNDRPGMTLRDYFAGQALPSILKMLPGGTGIGTSHPAENLNVAAVAYAVADAMLLARQSNDMEGEGR